MQKARLSVHSLVLAGCFAAAGAPAQTISQDFSADPARGGWEVLGDTNLFAWDSSRRLLRVTWDSTQPNGFFCHSLTGYVTRYDDFRVEFDLTLADITSGVEPDKTMPVQLGLGFLNRTNIANPDYSRCAWGGTPNVAELCYYGLGSYEDEGATHYSLPALVPSFIAGTDSYAYAPAYDAPYTRELPLNQTVHIALSYTATNQSAALSVTTNGVALGVYPDLVLDEGNNFPDGQDFRVDTFSISSYHGNDWSSILAHGAVANIVVTIPPPARDLAGRFSNGLYRVEFSNATNWLYTLERATNLAAWTNVTDALPGNGGRMALEDAAAPPDRAFYRIRAQRP